MSDISTLYCFPRRIKGTKVECKFKELEPAVQRRFRIKGTKVECKLWALPSSAYFFMSN